MIRIIQKRLVRKLFRWRLCHAIEVGTNCDVPHIPHINIRKRGWVRNYTICTITLNSTHVVISWHNFYMFPSSPKRAVVYYAHPDFYNETIKALNTLKRDAIIQGAEDARTMHDSAMRDLTDMGKMMIDTNQSMVDAMKRHTEIIGRIGRIKIKLK